MRLWPAFLAGVSSTAAEADPEAVARGRMQWRNTHWTRLDWTNARGLRGLGGPKPDPDFFVCILIFQLLGVSHLFYSTADFFLNSFHQRLRSDM